MTLEVVLILAALAAGWWSRTRWDRAGRKVDRLAALDSDPVCPACQAAIRPGPAEFSARDGKAAI
jgi:hypothetical protein